MLYVTGYNTTIIGSLKQYSKKLNMIELPINMNSITESQMYRLPYNDCDKIIFCHGYLDGRKLIHQTEENIIKSLTINLISTMLVCDRLLQVINDLRVIIMGSESAYYGSHDATYACAKAGLECYVKTKKLKTNQQLLCISPHIIIDAGMTTRRNDLDNVKQRANEHPKGRWLKSMEVAKTIYHYLYIDEGYTTGQVIRMNGGLK